MNAEEASAWIPRHRPGRADEGALQKAMRLAGSDAALAAQLAAQTRFDEQVLGAIQSIVPPEDLGHKLRAAGARKAATPVRKTAQIFNPVVLTAVLGVLLIIGFIAWTMLERMEKFPGRESAERMLGETRKMSGVELDPVKTSAGAMQDWFYMRGFEGFAVPRELAPLPAVGSRVFRLDGHPVAQIVIDRHDSLLYVFRASDFGMDLPADQPWRVIAYDDWTAALQRRGDICSMIAFKGTRAEMREFLASIQTP